MGTVIPNRMRHALEALVNYNDQPTEEYTVKFTRRLETAVLAGHRCS